MGSVSFGQMFVGCEIGREVGLVGGLSLESSPVAPSPRARTTAGSKPVVESCRLEGLMSCAAEELLQFKSRGEFGGKLRAF